MVPKSKVFKLILAAVSFHSLIPIQLLDHSSPIHYAIVSFSLHHLKVHCLTTKLYLSIHKLL